MLTQPRKSHLLAVDEVSRSVSDTWLRKHCTSVTIPPDEGRADPDTLGTPRLQSILDLSFHLPNSLPQITLSLRVEQTFHHSSLNHMQPARVSSLSVRLQKRSGLAHGRVWFG